MEREQVRIDITERDMASTRGKLRRAKALRNALRQEAPGASVDGKHVESKDERGDKDAKHVPSKDQRGAVDAKRTGKHVERREPMTHGAGSAATGAPKARQIRARTRAVATRAVAHEEGAEVAQARSAEVAQVAQAQHSSESTAKMPPDMTRQMAADSTERTAHAKQEEREEKEERRTQRGLAKAKAKVLQLKEAERAFATGVDAIGVPAVAEAEDRHESLDEGGSPAREMELGVWRTRRLPLPCLCLCALCLCAKKGMRATPPAFTPVVHRRRRLHLCRAAGTARGKRCFGLLRRPKHRFFSHSVGFRLLHGGQMQGAA